jgi:hypothetical protein
MRARQSGDYSPLDTARHPAARHPALPRLLLAMAGAGAPSCRMTMRKCRCSAIFLLRQQRRWSTT